MRLVSFERRREVHIGAEHNGGVIDLNEFDDGLPKNMQQFLALGAKGLERARKVLAGPLPEPFKNVSLLPPVTTPQKIICVGLNYQEHASESGARAPKEPVLFSKYASALIGPDEPIVLPPVSNEVDYEAELVAVIGKQGRNIAKDAAWEHVAGYACGHDVSARDWQLKKAGGQWMVGKTFDTFAPLGPALVTVDEIPDPHVLGIRLRLNGETMQEANTSDMVFKINELVAYISQIVTLEPGDLIYTGTPSGVGFARKPPVFLKAGDVTEVEIDGLGTLRNKVVQG